MNRILDLEKPPSRNGSSGLSETVISAEKRMPMSEALSKAALNGRYFLEMDIPKRPYLMGDWFCEGDLGFVFAPRGVGKTWFAHMLLASLSSGHDLDEWEVPEPLRVCLLDGEMPPDSVQDRIKNLGVDGDNFFFISHQFLFDRAETSLQLGDAEHREALLDYCVEKQIKVLVIDNLSSMSDIKENDNDDWSAIGDWLLEYRRRGIAVIVVHHAGRNGQMRGASRREDAAFWVIKLDDSKERTNTEDGARFVSKFTKSRNSGKWPTNKDWHITVNDDGNFNVDCEQADNETLVYSLIKDGVDKCSDIADSLNLGKGTVSKIATRLEKSGKINKKGGGNAVSYVAN